MVASEIIKLMKAYKGSTFFLAAGFFRPHCPYIAPEKYFNWYDIDDISLPGVPEDDWDDIPPLALDDSRPYRGVTDTSDLKKAIRAYYASVSFMDAQVGRILDAVNQLGLTDNTIVVFASDHGYLLGEHRQWHKMMLFEEATQTPLIVYHPDMEPPENETTSLVEFVDIYPTLAEMCGLDTPDYLTGRSFSKLFDDPNADFREYAYSVVSRHLNGVDRSAVNWGMEIAGEALRKDSFRYVEWDSGDEGIELYDVVNDPGEHNNLAKDPEYFQVCERLSTILGKY